jgi:hypothetical protein
MKKFSVSFSTIWYIVLVIAVMVSNEYIYRNGASLSIYLSFFLLCLRDVWNAPPKNKSKEEEDPEDGEGEPENDDDEEGLESEPAKEETKAVSETFLPLKVQAKEEPKDLNVN